MADYLHQLSAFAKTNETENGQIRYVFTPIDFPKACQTQAPNVAEEMHIGTYRGVLM